MNLTDQIGPAHKPCVAGDAHHGEVVAAPQFTPLGLPAGLGDNVEDRVDSFVDRSKFLMRGGLTGFDSTHGGFHAACGSANLREYSEHVYEQVIMLKQEESYVLQVDQVRSRWQKRRKCFVYGLGHLLCKLGFFVPGETSKKEILLFKEWEEQLGQTIYIAITLRHFGIETSELLGQQISEILR